MTKSELIERLATQQSHIPAKTVEDAVKEDAGAYGLDSTRASVLEIRGFGSFSLLPRTTYRT